MLSSRARDFLSYRERRTGRTAFWRIVRFVLLLFVGYLILTHFFITSHAVSSIAMEPELRPGDLVLSTPLLYGPTIPFTNVHLPALSQPHRGDVVIAVPPYYRAPSLLSRIADTIVRFFTLQQVTIIHNSTVWEHRRFIKRVIALPGDTVRMSGFTVYVRPRGHHQFVPEYQLASGQYETKRTGLPKNWGKLQPFSGTMPDLTLGPNEYFLVGDNRVSSVDSRYFGTVKRSSILERVLIRYYPFHRFAVVH